MGTKDSKLSPMMVQYFQIKAQYNDAILFFRLGDFYEMFFEDARIASQELDLVLTGRDCGQEERAPMCGVPFHSADSYIAKLVSRGYKVAICEQMEDPALVKGLVKRDVIRIITPGTVIEGNMLEDGVNNYLCSIFAGEKDTGVCFADVSTGEFHITVLNGDDIENKLINQLSTYSPRELIINSKSLDYNQLEGFAKRLNANVEVLDDDKFDF
ncbi:MAG: DNA mismatch repair protein MutS, partial [Eubacterium sp.]